MKPRSRVEKEFVERANSIPPYPHWRELLEWAKADVFKPESYYWQHRGKHQEIWCQCCGHREPCDSWLIMSTTGYTCPECGAETEVKRLERGRSTLNEFRLVTVFDVVNGVQVLRVFEVSRCNRGHERTEYTMPEVYQCWILDNGREIITSRGYSRSFYSFTWNYGAPYSIGVHRAPYGYEDVYCVGDNYIYPKMKFSRAMKGIRMNKKMVGSMLKHHVDLSYAMTYLLKERNIESLLKTGYERLYWYLLGRRKKFSAYRHAVNICHRNKYPIDHPDVWVDYMDNLIELGLDTHNAHYVCPVSLTAEHTRVLRLVNRRREKEAEEKRMREAAKDEAAFQKRRSPYFGLSFGGDGFTVVCIQSVREVAMEGKQLHHCVFTNRYYNREDSLLMSARDNVTGLPLETIEINLRTLTIAQCRGMCNQPSEYHDRIVSLVESHMPDIRYIVEGRRETA